MIQLHDVSAWYGDVIALNGVTLDMKEPVVGLLGPNGAGKSTMLALLAGLREPNAGAVLIDGHPSFDNPDLLRRLGLVPEPLAPSAWLTGRRFVVGLARMSGMSGPAARTAARKVLTELGLKDAMDRPIRGYSQGMRQRVKLAQALVHKPRLLLLDEPFTGLDPPGRAAMTRAIRQAAEAGTQVLFSSHVLAEVEAVTHHVVMLRHGRVVAQGGIREVRQQLTAQPIAVGIRSSAPRQVAKALVDLEGVETLEIRSEELLVRVAHGTEFFRALTDRGRDLPITAFGPVDEDLESVYQMMTTKTRRRRS